MTEQITSPSRNQLPEQIDEWCLWPRTGNPKHRTWVIPMAMNEGHPGCANCGEWPAIRLGMQRTHQGREVTKTPASGGAAWVQDLHCHVLAASLRKFLSLSGPHYFLYVTRDIKVTSSRGCCETHKNTYHRACHLKMFNKDYLLCFQQDKFYLWWYLATLSE